MEGQVSYSALVDVAVKCAFPNIETDANGYDCTFTYYDVDDDCITIASTEELMDAIDQFSSKENPVLRITTDVKRKETSAEPDSDPEAEAEPEPAPRADKTSSPVDTKPNQLQNMVEACVSVLTAAVVTLQNQIAEVHNSQGTSAKTDASGPAVHGLPNTDAENAAAKDEETAAEDVREELPFIHGRHTCDGCLCTPIIGTRYHSTNLPDYDLCAKCRDNYKGTDILFETQQLGTQRIVFYVETLHHSLTFCFFRSRSSIPGTLAS